MNDQSLRDNPGMARRKPRLGPRGRPLDTDALHMVARLVGERGRMADQLIENLHRLQDHLGCLPAPHRRALAEWMNLPMAQIEEVATFYAHFDCVEDLAERPAPITIRVCSSLPCQMAGAEALRLALLAKAIQSVSGLSKRRVSAHAMKHLPFWPESAA